MSTDDPSAIGFHEDSRPFREAVNLVAAKLVEKEPRYMQRTLL